MTGIAGRSGLPQRFSQSPASSISAPARADIVSCGILMQFAPMA